MIKSQVSSLWSKKDPNPRSPIGIRTIQIPRVPPWDQKCSNPKDPPLGSKMVNSQGSSFVFQNDQISRVPPWVQKWSNPKGPPLGSEMFKSQGPPRGFKNGQTPRVLFWHEILTYQSSPL